MDKNGSPSSQNVKSSSSEALNKEGNPLSAKKSNQTEQEAANKAFNALFSGSRSQKTPVTTAVVAKAAPWPSVNHVQQKPTTNNKWWDVCWPQMRRLREVPRLEGKLASTK